jgi:peptide/nickel transport system substrate-binding protein
MTRWVLTVLVLAAVVAAPAGSAPEQAPRRGGVVHFGPVPEPACLNRLVAKCNEVGLLFVAEKVLEPAFDVGPEFTFRPRLVSRVTVTEQPPFTLTYHIRPEARWSDGVPVSAADFVFTHEARVARRASLYPDEQDLLSRVRRVEVVDAKTVQVVLRTRFAGWHGLFPNVLPRHALEGENLATVWSGRIDNPKTGNPIGSGPFLVERWERGKELTLVRNERYRGPHAAHLDRLVIGFRDGGDPLGQFRSGAVDVLYAIPTDLRPLRREKGLRVVAPPSSSWDQLTFNLGRAGHPALRKTSVRQAVAYGLDRVRLVRGVVGSFNATLRPLDSLVYLTQSPYYRRNWSRYRHRPAHARRLLEQAGCRRGADGIYSCAGERLSLRFVTTAGVPPRRTLLSLAQAQLRKIGVEVVPTYAPPRALFESLIPSGEYDVALFGWAFDPNAVTTSAIYRCGGGLNFGGYCSRSVTQDLGRAAGTLDLSAQARILNRVDARMARDVPLLPLFQIPFTTVFRTSVRNFAALPFNPLSDAERWWLAEPR